MPAYWLNDFRDKVGIMAFPDKTILILSWTIND